MSIPPPANTYLPESISQSVHAATPLRRKNVLGLWEICVFALVCSADMISTLYWYAHGQALESNPLLAYWLSRSVTAFCIAKLLSFVPLLLICAVYRHKYPKLITPGLRIALVAYVGIYLVSVGVQLIPH